MAACILYSVSLSIRLVGIMGGFEMAEFGSEQIIIIHTIPDKNAKHA